MNTCQRHRGQQGMALAVVLIIVLVLAVASAAFLGVTNSDLHLTHREVEATRAFYVAQAGIEKAIAEINVLYAKEEGESVEDLERIAAPVPVSAGDTLLLKTRQVFYQVIIAYIQQLFHISDSHVKSGIDAVVLS